MLDKTKFTNEELSGLYRALYEMNLAGMDPEFFDLYERSYAPENVLADGMSQEDLCRAINSLIGDKDDDTAGFIFFQGDDITHGILFFDP